MINPKSLAVLLLVPAAAFSGALPAAGAAGTCRDKGVSAARNGGLKAAADRAYPGYGFVVQKVICRDAGGDRRADLAVMLRVGRGTGSSPTPWGIFNRTDRGYVLKFKRVNTVIYRLSVANRRVTVRRPIYRSGDATCCPSSVRNFSYRWSSNRYVLD